ncbi:MAG: ShlB/FhaC/HecB family hemolysin secretion/activation protein [Veillonellaceae bacterium]|nr:ShlB/FhaC/HecB family hemolysin secretion/activation protein [Veillonellaceae bacterium]
MLKKTVVMAAAALAVSSICQAAVSDAGIGDYYKKEQKLYQKDALPSSDNILNKVEQEKDAAKPDNIIIAIRKINTNKSAILSDAELKGIKEKYEGRELGLSDLYKAVAEINALYKAKSYITAKAVLPPQKIENGIVKIQLVEGRFGEFLIQGNRHTEDSYFKNRLSLSSGDLVKLDQLQKDIFYFNNTNDVALRAELRPGKEFGTTDCILLVKEPAKWQTTMFADNAGRDESGLYRAGIVVTNNSLFGNRETLTLNPTWTKGTMGGSIAYSAPVDKLGTRLGFSYSKNQVNIVSGPYESMDIAGDSSDVGLSISHPFAVTANRKVEGYAELHWKDSSTDFFGNTLLDSEVKTATLGSSIRTIDNKGVWYSQYSLTGISASKKDAYTDKHFWRFNLSAIRHQALADRRSIIWRLSGQMTNNSELPSSEQMSLGGMSSVKGYHEGVLCGDQGYYIGVEYNFPLHDANKFKGLLFLDHGSTYNSFTNGSQSHDFLTSTGIGVVFSSSPGLFGKVVVGIPLNSSKEHDKTRIHLFLQSKIK